MIALAVGAVAHTGVASPTRASAFCLRRATASPALLPAIVDFLAALVLA
jgi:hypothetical protein